MELLFDIFSWVLYILFAVNVLYILVFSIASRLPKQKTYPPAALKKRFALLIAAYREDKVIEETVKACLAQDYPQEYYDVVVISDHMQPSTNERLRSLPIKLLQVDFKKSTNTKSLKAALKYLGKDAYDTALIIDADNIIAPDYLRRLNDAFATPGIRVIQTHRMAKNLNTDMAYLDAVSEEINNSIFRMGHVNLGLSSALIGSGMAFEYKLFYKAMMSNTSVGGFDRVLEMKLLYKGVRFHYMPDLRVRDEKIQRPRNFYQQRRRWLSAQYYSLLEFCHHLLPAIRHRKWDFCDKLYQQAMLSRVLLLGFTFLFALAYTLIPGMAHESWAIAWWSIFTLLLAALALAVPGYLWTKRLLRALCLVPYSFVLMVINLFRMREANKRFIHTTHGVDE